MPIEDPLQGALHALEDARLALTHVGELLPTSADLRQALREMEDAEEKIAGALRDFHAAEPHPAN